MVRSDEVSLSEREGRLRALVEQTGDLLLELESSGRFSFVHHGVSELLGYSAAELAEIPAAELVHPDDWVDIGPSYEALFRAEGQAESIHRFRHKDGSWVWIHELARSYRDEDGAMRLVLHGRNITRQKAAEEALERQLEVQRDIVRLSSELICLAGDALDERVFQQMGMCGRLADCDRTWLFVMDLSGREPHVAFEWTREGAESGSPPLSPGDYPWTMTRLIAGLSVHFESLDEFPLEAASEREALESRGTTSVLILPVRSRERLIGFQFFERTQLELGWQEDQISSLGLVAELLVSALRRQATERALKPSEERFRTIAEQATELVAELDENGRFLYVSPSYERLLGRSPESLIGRSCVSLIHPDNFSGQRQKFERSFSDEVPSDSTHQLLHANGEWRWFRNHGQAYQDESGDWRFVSIGHDVTDEIRMHEENRRQLEVQQTVASLSQKLLVLGHNELETGIHDALAESAELADADYAYLGAYPLDSLDRGALYQWKAPAVRPFTRRQREWSSAQLRGGQLLHYPDVRDMPAEASEERAIALERGVRSMLAIPVRTRNETVGVIGFETVDAQRSWSDQEITMLGVIGEILTSALRRMSAEIALRESQRDLAQSQKLEAVGRLAGGVAHDFNNLLTVILGFSRPLAAELAPGSAIQSDVAEIQGAAERAAALTKQLLLFSRRQQPQTELFDVNDRVEALAPLLQRLLGEDVELLRQLTPGIEKVRGDPHQIDQVVVNLAVNARDAMPEGGILRIGTDARVADAALAERLRLVEAAEYLVLSVSDEGEGIDEQTRLKIFDPFFTTKDQGKGTGLGLSIVYTIVQQTGGAIEVDPRPGSGTTFKIWLPTSSEPLTSPDLADVDVDAVSHGTESVLLVEDEPAVRRFVSRALKSSGYVVIEAGDGEAAIACASSPDQRIDVVISDVVMPKMGGAQLKGRLLELRPDLPFLFISGHPKDRSQDPNFADTPLLEKPFAAEELLTRLRDLLDLRDLRDD